jgi:hypothetical protein
MISHPSDTRRMGAGASVFAWAPLFAFVVGGPLAPATAGEFDRSTLHGAVAAPTQCESRNEGPDALQDSGECSRISGYVTAGARFGPDERIGGLPSPFGPLDAPEFVGSIRPSGAVIVGAPASREPLFLPPAAADEAR